MIAVMHRLLLVAVAALAVGCAVRQPATLRVTADQVYAERDGEPLYADVYAPVAAGPHPGVLLVHGGSWQRGRRGDMAAVARRLAARGYVAVSIDYRLAPDHHFPAQLDDCRDAVRWMRQQAARLDVDPTRIAAFGYSAGGHLAALLATDQAPDASARVQAAVAGGAPTDLARFGDARVMRRLLGGEPDELARRARAASPLTYASADDPPLFLYHGRYDWMVDRAHAMALRDRLDEAGVAVQYLETPQGHLTTFALDDEPVAAATAFLDVWLAGAAR
jgi:acetyl esterase/lipase